MQTHVTTSMGDEYPYFDMKRWENLVVDKIRKVGK